MGKMGEAEKNIAFYKEVQQDLESEHMGKWVLIHKAKLVSTYDDLESTAEDAVKKFGAGPYLIRQVGASTVTLPASVMFQID